MVRSFQEKDFQEDHFRLFQMIAAVDDEIEHQAAHDAGQPAHVLSDGPGRQLVQQHAGIGTDECLDDAGNDDDRPENLVDDGQVKRISDIGGAVELRAEIIIPGHRPVRTGQPLGFLMITHRVMGVKLERKSRPGEVEEIGGDHPHQPDDDRRLEQVLEIHLLGKMPPFDTPLLCQEEKAYHPGDTQHDIAPQHDVSEEYDRYDGQGDQVRDDGIRRYFSREIRNHILKQYKFG